MGSEQYAAARKPVGWRPQPSRFPGQARRPIAALRPRPGAALQHPYTRRSCLARRDRRVTVCSADLPAIRGGRDKAIAAAARDDTEGGERTCGGAAWLPQHSALADIRLRRTSQTSVTRRSDRESPLPLSASWHIELLDLGGCWQYNHYMFFDLWQRPMWFMRAGASMSSWGQ